VLYSTLFLADIFLFITQPFCRIRSIYFQPKLTIMKRTLLAITAILAMSLSSHAQEDGGAFSQGQSTVSLGYGVGNIFKSLFTLSGAAVSSTGPFALTYEYGVTDKISAGLSVGYSSVTQE
jgi:hypothetical protein